MPSVGSAWAVGIAPLVMAGAAVGLHLLVGRPAQALGKRLAARG